MSPRSTNFPLYALAIGVLASGIAGCHGNNQNQNNTNPAQTQNAVATQAADESQDPAEQANLAPAVNTTPEAAEQQAAPAGNEDYSYNAPEAEEPASYAPDPPPPLPEYDQPEAPGPDYIWTPGYWNYANTGYYWVPGVWVLAPYTGALWTPGYWGFYNGRYLWHRGYWGPHIGFYGGVDYGHGYTGVGYVGGYWDNGSFRYNTAVTRVNPNDIHDTYSHRVRVVNNRRVSYNGGHGGLPARPLTSERVALREHHMAPLPAQTTHTEQARKDRSLWVSQNHGHPGRVAVSQPLNVGRHAPAEMPANVRDEVQHERAGRPPAGAQAQLAPRQENRPGQPARPQAQNPSHNQARPAQTYPETRNQHYAAPRSETNPANRPSTRNEARPPQTRTQTRTQTNHSATRPENGTTTRPQTRSTGRPETGHPAHAHPAARQNANQRKHTAAHTQSHKEKREQPKTHDHNPQP